MWFRTVRRATKSEHQRRDWRLLTCTWRNQPVRMICASARASLRSVLFGRVFIAAFAWRVSMQTAGQPASVSPSCSQAVSEHASIPTRASGRSSRFSASCKASGALSARASFTIVPSASTTQMAVSSSDTSSPA